MQISLQKFYRLFLTVVGLALLAIAAMLNHYHPHNQGIADITKTSIYKRLGIDTASSNSFSSLSYVKALPAAAHKDTPKMSDPTATPDNTNAALPEAPMAGNDSSPTGPSDSTQKPTPQIQSQNKNQDSTKS